MANSNNSQWGKGSILDGYSPFVTPVPTPDITQRNKAHRPKLGGTKPVQRKSSMTEESLFDLTPTPERGTVVTVPETSLADNAARKKKKKIQGGMLIGACILGLAFAVAVILILVRKSFEKKTLQKTRTVMLEDSVPPPPPPRSSFSSRATPISTPVYPKPQRPAEEGEDEEGGEEPTQPEFPVEGALPTAVEALSALREKTPTPRTPIVRGSPLKTPTQLPRLINTPGDADPELMNAIDTANDLVRRSSTSPRIAVLTPSRTLSQEQE